MVSGLCHVVDDGAGLSDGASSGVVGIGQYIRGG
ncbi:hypothetical protein CGRA01v4_02824 [Colletotrichum graminicola]|nr:hypothetical protein CGRA01v4_02824 [Colletotrichum graminicola]